MANTFTTGINMLNDQNTLMELSIKSLYKDGYYYSCGEAIYNRIKNADIDREIDSIFNIISSLGSKDIKIIEAVYTLVKTNFTKNAYISNAKVLALYFASRCYPSKELFDEHTLGNSLEYIVYSESIEENQKALYDNYCNGTISTRGEVTVSLTDIAKQYHDFIDIDDLSTRYLALVPLNINCSETIDKIAGLYTSYSSKKATVKILNNLVDTLTLMSNPDTKLSARFIKDILIFIKLMKDHGYINRDINSIAIKLLQEVVEYSYTTNIRYNECEEIIKALCANEFYSNELIKTILINDTNFTSEFKMYSEIHNNTIHCDIHEYLLENSNIMANLLNMSVETLSKIATEATEDEEPEEDIEIDASQSDKGAKKSSKAMDTSSKKIYSIYKKYKDSEDKVDSQLSKLINSLKNRMHGDKTDEILGEKAASPIRVLKKVLATGAIFNVNKIGALLYLIVGSNYAKKRTAKQRKEILEVLNSEIEIINEKIEDAKGDGNRKAKYEMMRTKNELEAARDKVKYGLSASEKAADTAKKVIDKAINRK